MKNPSNQLFVNNRNPPGFIDGLSSSHLFGWNLRQNCAHDNSRIAFENAMRAAGVGVMNFRRWITGDYVIPAVEMSWLGWQGKLNPVEATAE